MKLKILTYNIRAGFGGEQERLPVREGLERIAEVIEAQGPDVVFMQEVECEAERTDYIHEAQWLAERTGFQHPTFSAADHGHNRCLGNAVLIKRGESLETGTTLLFKPDYSQSHPEYPNYFSEQRALHRASVSIQGIDLNFFCTHLGLTQEQREKQIATILQVMSDFPSRCVLAGDFNAPLEAPEMLPFSNTFNEAFATLEVPTEDRLTFPAGLNPVKTIDTFFVTKDIESVDVQVIRDETLASDHNPVVMTVSL